LSVPFPWVVGRLNVHVCMGRSMTFISRAKSSGTEVDENKFLPPLPTKFMGIRAWANHGCHGHPLTVFMSVLQLVSTIWTHIRTHLHSYHSEESFKMAPKERFILHRVVVMTDRVRPVICGSLTDNACGGRPRGICHGLMPWICPSSCR
jgi:hypothetical protein